MQIKVFHSMDFQAAQKRIEKNEVDPYQVHLEDYENINDMINRAIRTKGYFEPTNNPSAIYDGDLDGEKWIAENDDYEATAFETTEEVDQPTERSDEGNSTTDVVENDVSE